MPVTFRNVDALPSDDVRTWPYEALVEVIDEGLVADWQPILAEIRRSPWGSVARRVLRYLTYRQPDGAGNFFALAVERARRQADQLDRDTVVERLREAVRRSGLSNADLANRVGTSPSRLSTYLSGKVMPSASMMVRIERLARDSRVSSGPLRSGLPSEPV
jgi:hypothetical protein